MTTRDKILQTAYDLFMEKGYQNTTIRQIAKKAEVNLGLIPYYFKQKEQLGCDVYAIMMSRLFEKIDYNIISLNNPIEKYYFRYLMIQYYQLIDEHINEFYISYLISCDLNLKPHHQTQSSFLEIIEAYNLNVPAIMLTDYCSILFGAERALMARKVQGTLHMSYFDINATLVRIGTRLLGVEQALVEDAIHFVDEKIRKTSYDWSLLD